MSGVGTGMQFLDFQRLEQKELVLPKWGSVKTLSRCDGSLAFQVFDTSILVVIS